MKKHLLSLLLLIPKAVPSHQYASLTIEEVLVEAPRRQIMVASYYHSSLHRHMMASGRRYDERSFTVAHRTLPFGTKLLLTSGGHSCVCVVRDRGPFWPGRQLDLSRAAARKLGMLQEGIREVEVEIL